MSSNTSDTRERDTSDTAVKPYSHKPHKRLGQHFLINTGVLDKIVAAVDIQPDETVIEVGPGRGQLTDALLAAGAHVVAIEKDRTLAASLKEKYAGNSGIEIIEGDILKFDPTRYTLQATRYKLVGNIPYYLTSHLFRIVLQEWPTPERVVFMIQREVADRMVAKPPHMNMLAVLVQSHAAPERIMRVSKGSFSPPPKVESAVVRLVPKSRQLSAISYKLLAVASQGFKHPRKKLANNLPLELLEQAGIDPARRAETLTIAEWQKLAEMSTKSTV